ncbi:uncharacterized protein ACA1_201100, partial [Acanthamoeba castellanii str. Neff]
MSAASDSTSTSDASTVTVLARNPLQCADDKWLRVADDTPSARWCCCIGDSMRRSDSLHQALAHLLNYYPHLTGRIAFNPDAQDRSPRHRSVPRRRCGPVRRRWRRRRRAAPRLVALTLPGAGGNALLAPFDPSMEGVCCDPILTVQHTRFACGGVALGVRLLHMVCDADGFFQFLIYLADPPAIAQ